MNATQEALRTSKLIMVTANNNNKFYEMKESGDGTFEVKYGRVGTAGAFQNYPIAQWDRKYKEKIRKGYKDQSHLFAKPTESLVSFEGMSDDTINSLIKTLYRYAQKSISQHYNVTAEEVTQAQLEEAQAVLNQLVGAAKIGMDVQRFNQLLIELYQVIPRRMSSVTDHLATSCNNAAELEEVNKLISQEQETLDVMEGQVKLTSQTEDAPREEKIDIIQKLGIDIKKVDDSKVIKNIQKMMGSEKGLIHQVFEVSNKRTQVAFDNYVASQRHKKTTLFWHGSRNENWMSILETGLVLRPTNAIISGKMFGYGLYFADKFKKSLNYSSLRGSYWAGGNSSQAFLAIYDVYLGRSLKLRNHQPWCYELNEEKLKERGRYNSLYAKGGADLINNEYIVYNENQCTIKYLVEVKK
ncbi:WGR domain-containing protein [Flammeovirgaceae bacterium SG7u.111]|nr:WGR domain-containing protein [Flammeovirgaceae bacterium SG7u.132]WPO38111.1 WGR domain-containing protein [Flammeovirgaceae bacterium SG7u.111]